jgi:hypothetical protein
MTVSRRSRQSAAMTAQEAVGTRWYRRDGSLACERLERRSVHVYKASVWEADETTAQTANGGHDGSALLVLAVVVGVIPLLPVLLPFALAAAAVGLLAQSRVARAALACSVLCAGLLFLSSCVLLLVSAGSFTAFAVHTLLSRPEAPAKQAFSPEVSRSRVQPTQRRPGNARAIGGQA